MIWTPEQVAELCQLFASGMTQTTIAARLDRTLKAVNSKLKRAGVDTKPANCRNGHPWAENEAFTSRGERYCRACYRARKGQSREGEKTTCRNGHPLVEDNLYLQGTKRLCRTCRRLQNERWRSKLTPEQIQARAKNKRISSRAAWRTPENIAKARALHLQGLTHAAVAHEIGNGCTRSAIKNISCKQKWPGPLMAPRPAIRSTWITAETKTLARALWNEGKTDPQIAQCIGNGCNRKAIFGLRKREKWGARAVKASYTPRLPYSVEQKNKLRELWTRSDLKVPAIREQFNAAGPAQFTDGQIISLAKRMGIKRPQTYLRQNAQRRGHLRWDKKPPAKPKSLSIPIPLREVYQRTAALGLPPSKRGDLAALNRAVQREKPTHPGFVLADYQPTRLRWAS